MSKRDWDARWLGLTQHVSGWSKDRSRTVGAVIVNDREVVVSLGWNGFVRGVNDTVECRHQRPEKYKWSEHAERNALYNAAAAGHSTLNCRIYQSMYPCSDCARGIVQSGIKEVITVKPDWNDPTYKEDFAVSRQTFKEAKVKVRFLPGLTPVRVERIAPKQSWTDRLIASARSAGKVNGPDLGKMTRDQRREHLGLAPKRHWITVIMDIILPRKT